jgi:DNA-directed RNA polymerase II subunit RPB2
LYYDYLADGQMGYGQNLTVAIGSFTGYNQDDGIIFNADSFQRGMFRNMTFRSYETFEEDDRMTKTITRVANPARIAGWTKLKPGVDYSKLDERGIIRVGERVDETTVLVGMYLQSQSDDMRDASLTAQVWTSGRVEKVAVMINNMGRALVKIRVIQDRIPELGDKFSTRHGQKGTIGMLIRSHDMPRTADGLVPDMIVNPHCMPSRMTMAQMLESNLGKAAAVLGAIGNATAFMNDGNPAKEIGAVLRDQLGMNPMGDDILYDGMSGTQIQSSIFMGNIYIMRLKHMPEDKWNARAEGRKEQRTHAPTGGRGNQGGLRIGEMERDAIVGHGITDFVRESYMKRADGYSTFI